jgi:hypothetical protein
VARPAAVAVADVAAPAGEPAATAPAGPAARPDPEAFVHDWERRGFEVEQRQRVVSLALENGRRLAVPVNEVRLRYVGDRTY